MFSNEILLFEQPHGIPSLGADGKVLPEQLPPCSAEGGLRYLGVWDASCNRTNLGSKLADTGMFDKKIVNIYPSYAVYDSDSGVPGEWCGRVGDLFRVSKAGQGLSKSEAQRYEHVDTTPLKVSQIESRANNRQVKLTLASNTQAHRTFQPGLLVCIQTLIGFSGYFNTISVDATSITIQVPVPLVVNNKTCTCVGTVQIQAPTVLRQGPWYPGDFIVREADGWTKIGRGLTQIGTLKLTDSVMRLTFGAFSTCLTEEEKLSPSQIQARTYAIADMVPYDNVTITASGRSRLTLVDQTYKFAYDDVSLVAHVAQYQLQGCLSLPFNTTHVTKLEFGDVHMTSSEFCEARFTILTTTTMYDGRSPVSFEKPSIVTNNTKHIPYRIEVVVKAPTHYVRIGTIKADVTVV